VKVALLTDCYLPRLGGIEVQTHDLAAQLQQRGHEVEVFTATQGQHGERHGFVEDIDGVRVHRMAVRLPWQLPVNPLAPPQVRRRLADGGFDVAHVHMGVVSPFATDLAGVALGLGMPTAITWHCLMEHSRPVFRVLGHARRWGERGASLSAVSGVAAATVQQVVGTGDGAPVRVVAAMRLATRKRPGAVLDIAERARAAVPAEVAMRLDLFGEGPERGRLERRVAQRGLDWVHLPGRVTRDQLRQAYWDADVYLTPVRLEAFGIAALEARTAGLPVLARSGSGVGDFIEDGVNGFLGDEDESLAAALADLVTDRDLRHRIAAQNATVPPAQGWAAVVALAEEEYLRAGAS
jgi:glycosyltransferase involved in cell wall biosynthesis